MANQPKHNNQPIFLDLADSLRAEASGRLDTTRRIEMGQFLTPMPTARLMASMFGTPRGEMVRVLDAGAGAGTLTAAWIAEMCGRVVRPKQVSVVAYEIERNLLPYLRRTLQACRERCDEAGVAFRAEIREDDFIEAGVGSVQACMFTKRAGEFDYAIVNPPYRKIRSDSHTRALLRTIGIEASNLYSAFLAIIIRLLNDGGELVMITPRSFCNGPYFRPFRKAFLGSMAMHRIHIYDSRKAAFKDDDVLQENVIFHSVKQRQQPDHVVVSSSPDPAGQTPTKRSVDYNELVSPTDPHFFIHISPDEHEASIAKRLRRLPHTLESLGISVSTGRVVDFRARQWLQKDPSPGTAPLIYPMHFNKAGIEWPRLAAKKANAIVDSAETAELLVPSEHYVLVKRFSAKEERRRIVAAIYDPRRLSSERVGFENHLNYFHIGGRGLDPTIACGLAAFLNSSQVDRYFRQFNGHTQVNASDLRSLRYPSLGELHSLGTRLRGDASDRTELDRFVEQEVPLMLSGAL